MVLPLALPKRWVRNIKEHVALIFREEGVARLKVWGWKLRMGEISAKCS